MVVKDLFCGAGGVARGIMAAHPDWTVLGVDIREQPRYPCTMQVADVMETWIGAGRPDFYWASPPCQRYSTATPAWRRGEHPNLIAEVRRKLLETEKPFIIENVPGAPIRRDLMLCGQMFGLPIVRHRYFELHGCTVVQPEHMKHRQPIYQITGGGPCDLLPRPGVGGARRKLTVLAAQVVMGIPGATRRELNEAVPVAYAKYIFDRLRVTIA